MEQTYVLSSNIDAIAYHRGDLLVRFKNGGCYKYLGVKRDHFNGLREAESAGKFLNQFIKPAHQFLKLDTDPFLKGCQV